MMEFPVLEEAYEDMLREMSREEAEAQLKVCTIRQAEAEKILAEKRKKCYEMPNISLPICFLPTSTAAGKREQCKFCPLGIRLAIQTQMVNGFYHFTKLWLSH